MGITKKVIDGVEWLGKKSIKKIPINANSTIIDKAFPFRLTKTGGALITLGAGGYTVGTIISQDHNRASMGYLSYEDGPARMTGPQTTGKVETAKRLSRGNQQVFNDIMSSTMNSSVGNMVENYGATGDLVFALHNGR